MAKELNIKYENQDFQGKELQRADELFGLFRVSSVVPDGKPTNFMNQIVIYTNGVTYRLYWYDGNANVWHYVTATA